MSKSMFYVDDPSRAIRACLRAMAVALSLAFAAPGAASAQATGTLAGRIIDGGSGATIEAAQVYLVGLNLGALSAANGRYLIVGVPVGTHELRVERLGYASATRQVTVEANQTLALDIIIEEQAIGLDEIVVTGEAGAARRREVGNAISQVNITQLVEPPRNIEDMLGGRIAGAVITENTGSAGSGNFIRLRGINSVAMSNSPLLYVDGIRVRSEPLPRNYPRGDRSNRGGNVQPSPLSMINPQDIERIEVIKGSAATALYGTEASAGVIQIFTKRGVARGAPEWTFGVQQSLRHVQEHGAEGRDWIDSDGVVMGNSDMMYMERWLREALGTELSASVRGGFQETSYFLSASYANEQYPMPNDFEKSFAVRGNLGFDVGGGLSLEWNNAFTKTHIQNTPAGDNAQGIPLNAWRPTTSYTGTVPTLRENISRLLDFDIDTYLDHFVTGLTARHQVTEQLDHRLTLGYDRTYSDLRTLRPYGFILEPEGVIGDKRWVGEIMTLDYVANFNQAVGESLALTFSAGGQVVETEETSTEGTGLSLPGPSNPTVNSGAITVAFEDRIRVINAGFFVQNRIGWKDRIFLTLGLRVDGNSAFGESLGLQPYPKVSASYVISDESFWNPSWGTVKLRAAYGQAGRAPGAFDAVRTWEPAKYSGESAFMPQNRGNPNLGPERTAEIEMGLTGSFFGDRLAVDLTHYRHETSDALFPVRRAPSEGGWNEQLENVGTLKNNGFEVAVDATIIDRASFGLDLGVLVYTNNSEVVDLGGAPEFSVGGGGYIVPGHPVPVLRSFKVMNPDEYADPVVEEFHFWGPTQPTHTITPSLMMRLPYGVTLSARGEYLGGHYIEDANTWGQISRGESAWPSCIGIQETAAAGRLDELTAYERYRCLQEYASPYDAPILRGDFFKLRDVSLRVPLSFWTGVSNPSLTLSARNLYRWVNSDWWVLEPEVGCNGMDCLVLGPQEHIPPPATFTAFLRFGL
jgi:TonB-dependent SusC/RagA subfamily outer membrane receptor